MKLIRLFILLPVLYWGQQLPQYTQYMFNDFAVNPAVAGKNPYYDVRSNSRYQWQGITDAPRTYVLSLNGPNAKMNMGFGGTVFTDIVGPTRRTGIQASYAYHIKLTEKIKMGMAASAGILQFAIDASKITLHDNGDDVISNAYQSVVVPDFGAGIHVYDTDNKYYFGISVPQLYNAKLKFFDNIVTKNSFLSTHYMINGGYNYQLNSDFVISPSFLLKYVKNIPMKLDVGVKATYKEQVWLGAAFRTHDAVSAMVGYTYKKYLSIGYSYDYTLTNLRKYNSGTHELMFGIKFLAGN